MAKVHDCDVVLLDNVLKHNLETICMTRFVERVLQEVKCSLLGSGKRGWEQLETLFRKQTSRSGHVSSGMQHDQAIMVPSSGIRSLVVPLT